MRQIPIERRIAGNNGNPDTLIMETIGYALVDDKHYAELNQYIWNLDINGYVRRSEGTGNNKKDVYIQHDIWCRLEGRPRTKLDHKDRNPLNNQLSNLRPATRSQNLGNRKLNSDSTTGFKGVYWHKINRKHIAYITINKQRIHLGCFPTALEAAKAYDIAAIKYFGEFAATNQSLGLIPLQL